MSYHDTHAAVHHAEHADHRPGFVARCLDEPQGHRHALPGVRGGSQPAYRRSDARFVMRAQLMYPATISSPTTRPTNLGQPRPGHGFLHGHACDIRRVRQLVRTADDRRADMAFPRTNNVSFWLLVPAAVRLAVRRLGEGSERRRRRARLDGLPLSGASPAGHPRPRPAPLRSCRFAWRAPRRS